MRASRSSTECAGADVGVGDAIWVGAGVGAGESVGVGVRLAGGCGVDMGAQLASRLRTSERESRMLFSSSAIKILFIIFFYNPRNRKEY